MSAINAAAGKMAPSKETDRRIVIIAGDNSWMHIYPDVTTMLACEDALAATPGPLEFFDVHGRRLGPVFAKPWNLEGLHETADQADPAAVQRRLCAVVDSVRAGIEHRLSTEPNPPSILSQALSQLPDLHGRTLVECFSLIEPGFGDGSTPLSRHDGGFLHNLLCH